MLFRWPSETLLSVHVLYINKYNHIVQVKVWIMVSEKSRHIATMGSTEKHHPSTWLAEVQFDTVQLLGTLFLLDHGKKSKLTIVRCNVKTEIIFVISVNRKCLIYRNSKLWITNEWSYLVLIILLTKLYSTDSFILLRLTTDWFQVWLQLSTKLWLYL